MGKANAGCRVGTVAHRGVERAPDNKKEKAHEALKEEVRGRPWDSLYWRGVPAMPRTVKPPPFEEHVLGGSTELLAQGRAYTDGACRGFLRRTRRAGLGACLTDDAGRSVCGTYGTFPDAYASSLREDSGGPVVSRGTQWGRSALELTTLRLRSVGGRVPRAAAPQTGTAQTFGDRSGPCYVT